MNCSINPDSNISREKIEELIREFESEGETLFDKGRNTIKLFELEQGIFNIKSFKIPNLVNKIAYKYFRKSKAERSYNYALVLKKKGIGTPDPIAYCINQSGLTFGESYYISEQIKADLTYRELVTDPGYPDYENILRAFTRFTFELHEKQVQFLDHSPGNTLIQKKGDDYNFFLVDLNRMNFKELNFEERMLNFSRLTPKKEMVEVMADEYAKLIDRPKAEVFEKMWFYTNQFQEKFQRKKRLKKKLKFWKN
ncbi:lipopolysaccharide kinase (Kdo/WaaP) family protein [Christiangramia gaetbulicola]|uniref:Lipopolysaccharide kinase (Kdo/WaaP) family protein n=1 Tax=Christiangramia gaetbulicola TaxID=703340 RepID=A0A2T6AEX3_9FLAO|nr:lipopolysaccharide kinase InaA family protein [Christiangramia gaetbulicola]PTX42365.1 lipopolysaccharide kinase (Kdo/WaaP) family protein [Christiangramia gaetbulicola]